MSSSQRSGRLPREFPLVGRKDELTRLYRLFGTGADSAALRVLVGEGGVGKSRLAATVGQEAERRGWRVVRGRAYPVERGVPFAILADAFVPLLQELDAPTLTVLTRGREGDLHRLFPAVGGLPATDDQGLDPEEVRTRLFWSFSSLLNRLAEREPLLVVLEDLHWADASSVGLLHFLVRHLDSDHLRIMGTCTAEERERNPALVQAEHSLEALGRLVSLPLPPFDMGDMEELIRVLFQMSGPPVSAFAQQLYGWTRGNIYFVEQILRALVQSGRLHREPEGWMGWEAGDLALPSTIRDAILSRFHTLPEEALRTAEVIAVVGRPTQVAVLEEAMDTDPTTLSRAVEELVSARVVEEEDRDGQVILTFYHPLTRETLYRGLSLTRQHLLHQQVAEALEVVYGDRAAEHADELAYHLSRHRSSSHDPRTVRYLALAGRGALARHADEEAASYLAAALNAAEGMSGGDGDGDGTGSAPSIAAIRRGLARARTRMGRYDEARVHWEVLLEEAEAGGDPQGQCRALRHLGLLSYWQGRHEEALDHLGAARELAGDDAPALRARIHLAAGTAQQQLGRARESRDSITRALAFAREVGDAGLLARVHRALALVNTWTGNTAEAREHGYQAVALGREADDPTVVFWGEWALASLEGLVGGPGPMAPWLEAARASARHLGSPVLELWTDELELEYAYFSGNWDGALEMGHRSVELARALNQTALLVRLLVWTSTVHLGRGEVDRGAALVDEAVELAGVQGSSGLQVRDVHAAVPALIGRTALLMAREEYREAQEVGSAGLALAEASGYVIWVLHRLLPAVAEASVRLRELERATRIMERLEREGGRMDHRLSLVWARAGRALVTWHSGALEEGAAELLEAARAMEEIGIPYEAARLRRQYAGRLAELGRPGEAAAELERVHQVFQELGAEPELDRTRAMFDEIHRKKPTVSRESAGASEDPSRDADLTPREWDVARLVAERMSNKAIAAELEISVRTVTTHCHRIYTKLELGGSGTEKRILLGDMVREGRLPPPDPELLP